MIRSPLDDPTRSELGTGRDGDRTAGHDRRGRLQRVAAARRRLAEQPSRAVLAVVLGLAALGQVRVWASGRGLWGDELAIAINLKERAVTELAGGLLYFQVAPVGWLVTGKVLLVGFGEDERLLRLPSLAAGLVTLALVAVIADRAVGRWAAVAAVGLVGATPTVLYYAGELKQYSVEAAVGLGLVVVGAALTRRDAAALRWPVLAAGASFAVVAVSLSYSALVVLAGVAGGVVAYLATQRRWSAALASVAVMAPAGLLGAGLVWRRRALPMHPDQDNFFPTGFPAPDGGAGAVLEWLPQMWSALAEDPLGWRNPWWTLLLVAAGLVALAARGHWRWAAILGGVLAAATAAAAVRGLPMAGRVGLYLVPVIVLLMVAGLAGVVQAVRQLARRQRLARRVWPAAAAAVVVTLAAMAGPPLQDGLAEVQDPRVRDWGREALWTVAERRQPGDVVVVYHFSHKLVRWYGPSVGVAAAERLQLVSDDSSECHPERVDQLLAGARRVWYLYGARQSTVPGDYQARVARELGSRGRITETHDYGSSAGGWVLVDLTAGPDPDPPSVPPDPQYACLTVD
jgi:hypothetical protein